MAFGLFVVKYQCPGLMKTKDHFLLPRFDGAILGPQSEWKSGNRVDSYSIKRGAKGEFSSEGIIKVPTNKHEQCWFKFGDDKWQKCWFERVEIDAYLLPDYPPPPSSPSFARFYSLFFPFGPFQSINIVLFCIGLKCELNLNLSFALEFRGRFFWIPRTSAWRITCLHDIYIFFAQKIGFSSTKNWYWRQK